MTNVRQAARIWLMHLGATAFAAFLGSIEYTGTESTGLRVSFISVVILVV